MSGWELRSPGDVGILSTLPPDLSFPVRVGQELSEPRDITTGVPQESVLSPFLFDMARACLPASLPADPRFPVRCSIYADDVALRTRGPRKFMPFIRCSLQRALDAVTAYLGGIGHTISTAKTEAMLIHPLASARRYTKQLKIGGRAQPWQQMPGKHRLNADLAAAAPGPGRDPGLVDAPGAVPSPGPGRDPGSDTNLGPDPVPGAAKVPEPSHHPDLSPPPQAEGGNRPSFGPIWDSEVIRLRKENEDLKNTINRLVKEMVEIKKLVSNASGNDAAVRASETPIPAPVDGTATSSKRRAVVNKTCESGVLSAEVSEIKQTLTALADSLKQVAPSVTFLTDSVRQIQVALGDPKRGLGALADRIDAIEARMASSATIVQPLLREARLKYPTSAPTEGPILCAALTAPIGGCPSGQPNNG
ncbi:hypothetical protein HPB49_013241 [Dermacentor silvarum]|uniref:Uncharacterized protein n=1 Tax=Dermacentor silvarum TaxID=543639 RepID=A0ACB8CKZ4_DERSI|nr:hypothetical protein HPB49_013241 [Dermacentor silvarum]